MKNLEANVIVYATSRSIKCPIQLHEKYKTCYTPIHVKTLAMKTYARFYKTSVALFTA